MEKIKFIQALIAACNNLGETVNCYWLASYDKRPMEDLQLALEMHLPADDFYSGDDFQEISCPWLGHNYNAYQDWVHAQLLMGDCIYYSKPKEEFFISEAYGIAKKLGKQYIILENLS